MPRYSLFIAVAMAILSGYLLLTMPGAIVQQYDSAVQLGPVVAWLYIAAIFLGASLLLGSAGFVIWKLFAGTLVRRRARRPVEQLSESEKRRRLAGDVAEARQIIAQEGVAETDRRQILAEVEQLEAKAQSQQLEIVAFGTVSSGKSSLLNALAGTDAFATDPRAGTTTRRNEVPCAALGNVILVDTPGLGEIDGADHAAIARSSARDADLILFVIDGPLKNFEHATLAALAQMGKRILLCLNKSDWYTHQERDRLLEQIGGQLGGSARGASAPLVQPADIVVVRSSAVTRPLIRILPNGNEQETQVEEPADISLLAGRMLELVTAQGKELLLVNLLLRSRGLVESALERVRALLDTRAAALVDRYTWQTAAIAAINPIPLLDVAAAGGMISKMVVDLAGVYRQPLTLELGRELLSGLTKNLATIGGATAIGSLLKAIPGFGTLAGGAVQAVAQALVTRWVGRTFMAYFRAGMNMDPTTLANEARRQWDALTRPESLAELAAKAASHLPRR